MAIAYFDCFSGAAGDMIVGALLDAGADFQALRDHLSRLGLSGYELRREMVNRSGLAATKFHVEYEQHGHAHRNLNDILRLIDAAALPPRAARRAKDIFTRLGQAEAKVHGTTLEEVHFHEVGAIDSIMDIVGACVALELLDVDDVLCSPLPLGWGTVQTEHGLLPVPAPATAELLKNAATAPGFMEGEATTPTAAAVMATLAGPFCPTPTMQVRSVGYGAGSRVAGPLPNVLRVFIGQADDIGTADSVVELSVNLDDCTGQIIGATLEKLLAAGCLDAWAMPILMKKSRPAWLLSALCHPADVAAAEDILYSQTTTLGVRRQLLRRSKLQRRHETVETPYGPLRVKIGFRGERIFSVAPEFADCLAAAESHHVPVKEVLAAAQAAFRQAGGGFSE